MIGLRRRGLAVWAKEGLRERLHDLGQGVSLPDTAAAKPHSSVVVGRCGHGEKKRGLARPGIETALQGQSQQGRYVYLLLRAVGVKEQLLATAAGPCMANGRGAGFASAG